MLQRLSSINLCVNICKFSISHHPRQISTLTMLTIALTEDNSVRKHFLYLTFITCTCCYCTACGNQVPQLIDTNSSIGNSEENNSFLEQFSDLDVMDVAYISFEDISNETPTVLDYDKLPYENNSLNMTLYSKIQTSDPPEEDTCPAIMLMTVNGQLYDFSIDGKASSNGFLETVLPINKDLRVPLNVKNLPAQKGENDFRFYIISTQCDSYPPLIRSYYGIFHSSTENGGIKPVILPDESEVKIIQTETTDGKSQNELINPFDKTIYMFDSDAVISTNNEEFSSVLKPSTQFYFDLPNINHDLGPSNRNGICLVLFNGKAMNIWNSHPCTSISMTDNEIMKRLLLPVDLKPGDKGQISCIYIDLENETGEPLTFENAELIQIAE